MGYGQKVDFSPQQHYPSPDKYDKKSDFNPSNSKGKSIGIGRDQCKAISLLPTSKTPGPGQY